MLQTQRCQLEEDKRSECNLNAFIVVVFVFLRSGLHDLLRPRDGREIVEEMLCFCAALCAQHFSGGECKRPQGMQQFPVRSVACRPPVIDSRYRRTIF